VESFLFNGTEFHNSILPPRIGGSNAGIQPPAAGVASGRSAG